MMKVLDLFSGIGSFGYGLEKSGHFTVSAFCEVEDYCKRVLKKNFTGVPIFNDIKKLNVNVGEYDVFTGGFPCQDISIAGKNKGINGERSGLWKEYKRLINQGKPKYAIIENVFALLGRGLETILQDLAEIGYDATWTTYDTKYFGLPQRRRRVYIVAVRDGIPANTDFFQINRRDLTTCRQEMDAFNEGFRWDFEEGKGDSHTFAYFTRQRSNEFKETGLSSTLQKRDYKDYVDLIYQNGRLRKITPPERLRLQGIPDNWFDGCELTNTQQFMCNGMSVPVVEHIGKLLFKFDTIVSAPSWADFYADGEYRGISVEFNRGSYFKVDGQHLESVFSVNWLRTEQDFVPISRRGLKL